MGCSLLTLLSSVSPECLKLSTSSLVSLLIRAGLRSRDRLKVAFTPTLGILTGFTIDIHNSFVQFL